MDCNPEDAIAAASLTCNDADVQEDPRCRLLQLPDEILINLLSRLHIRDLCSAMQSCTRFKALGESKLVQASVGFGDSWPNEREKRLYQRASVYSNIEAIIKLGVAALYGEGNVELAASLLIEAERLVGQEAPFSWLLFRPPWSSNACSKARIYGHMKRQVCVYAEEQQPDPRSIASVGHMAFCVAKTLTLMEDATKEEARRFYRIALGFKCGYAAVELARDPDESGESDPRTILKQGLPFGNEAVDLALCLQYANGRYPLEADKAFVRRTVAKNQNRAGGRGGHPKGGQDEDGKMRFILMDWLVEVADLKSYSRGTMYMAVALVDRYLARFTIPRKTLQLLGIACMVVAARFREAEVITIREAAWLTDNTYTYEQIVRTVGQALCAVEGRVWVPTTLDYLQLYLALAKAPPSAEEYALFVAEMSLLRTPLTVHAPSVLAAAVVYIAMHVAGVRDPWSKRVSEWTGLEVAAFADLATTTFALLVDREPVKDHRGVELKAVVDHYVRTVTEKKLPNLLLLPLRNEVFCQELQQRMAMEATNERVLNAPTPSHDFRKGSCQPLRLITNVASPAGAAERPKPVPMKDALATDTP